MKYFEVPPNILKYLKISWNILEYFAERRQSDELQRREKEQRGRDVVQSVATRYVLSLMPPIFVIEKCSNKEFVFCIVLLLLFSPST